MPEDAELSSGTKGQINQFISDHEHSVSDPDAFFDSAKQHEGSWWPDWQKWVAKHSNGKVPSRKPGDGKLKVIEDASGSYAKVRI